MVKLLWSCFCMLDRVTWNCVRSHSKWSARLSAVDVVDFVLCSFRMRAMCCFVVFFSWCRRSLCSIRSASVCCKRVCVCFG